MTESEHLYASWLREGSYFNRMLDCGSYRNWWVEIALRYLPRDVLDEHKENLVFIALAECDACRVAPQYREREIILLSDRIFPEAAAAEDDPAARYFFFVVLHEVAHAVKRHKSPRFDRLSAEDNEAQEHEANAMAFEWFNQHIEEENNPFLPPLTADEVKKAQENNQRAMKGGAGGV